MIVRFDTPSPRAAWIYSKLRPRRNSARTKPTSDTQENNNKMPTSIQAGFYSAALQYLNAVKAAGTDQSEAVMAKLKEIKWDDPVFGLSYIRADGRKMHNMYLFEVKKPSESKGAYDYYKLISTMSAEEAFRPMDQGECPLVAKKS